MTPTPKTATAETARVRRARRGFTLMEVMFAGVILLLMSFLFAAVFPTAVRGAQYSGNYTQAATLAQHKMDQLRTAGYSRLVDDAQGTALSKMSGLNIVDAQVAPNAYDFTTADGLVNSGAVKGYFPSGSTGTVAITPYTANGTPPGTVLFVTVTVAWTGAGTASSSYSTSALLSAAATP